MNLDAHALDRWLTTEPAWRTEDPPMPRCEVCGCFLPWNADQAHDKVVAAHCDGGKHYAEYGWYGSCHGSGGEISGPHEAHDWQEYEGVTLTTECRHCGYVHTEEDY